MRYGFMSVKGTVDVVFVLRRLAEKSTSKNKLLFVFIDRVPREFIRSALRRKGVPKHLVNGVMTLYKGCKTAAPVEGELSGSFSVKVGVHQASALNPLLPVSVIDVLTEDLKEGSLMELLHANNLALRGKHLNDIMGQYLRKTGEGIRRKASRVDVEKTRRMQLLHGKKAFISKVDPCAACGEQVGCCNSIWCKKCQKSVHRHFSSASRRVSLLSFQDVFVCETCMGHNCSVKEKVEFKRDEDALEHVKKFCYLGDMFSSYGGASKAVSTRIGST